MKNTDKNLLDEALARNTLDQIPEPKSDAKEILGLTKSSGRTTGYQLSDGSTVSKEEGVAMAKAGDIKGVGIAHRKDTEYPISVHSLSVSPLLYPCTFSLCGSLADI